MIREGEEAPSFELPGIIGGRHGWVSLDSFLGESVIVLVFYPADFNPSCTDQSTDLDEFDVFRMQSDAAVVAISGDSVYSHRQFARAHDLHLPLLADARGEVAETYGVASDDPRYPNDRAVFVIDHDGIVTYSWVGDDIEDRPNIESIQAAFRAVDDADLAETQYREGCDRYDDGRDTFVEGMRAYERRDWVLARGEFDTARDSLSVASNSFRRAIRFSEDEEMEASFERAHRIVEELDRAIGLFAEAASAHASGASRRGEELREQAEAVVETVQELGAPPDPEALPVDIDDDRPTGEGTLDIDVVLGGDDTEESTDDAGAAAEPATAGGERAADADGPATVEAADGTDEQATVEEADDIDADEDIDDAELDAITTEIETQDASETDE